MSDDSDVSFDEELDILLIVCWILGMIFRIKFVFYKFLKFCVLWFVIFMDVVLFVVVVVNVEVLLNLFLENVVIGSVDVLWLQLM